MHLNKAPTSTGVSVKDVVRPCLPPSHNPMSLSIMGLFCGGGAEPPGVGLQGEKRTWRLKTRSRK
jgi:hypothetical protein